MRRSRFGLRWMVLRCAANALTFIDWRTGKYVPLFSIACPDEDFSVSVAKVLGSQLRCPREIVDQCPAPPTLVCLQIAGQTNLKDNLLPPCSPVSLCPPRPSSICSYLQLMRLANRRRYLGGPRATLRAAEAIPTKRAAGSWAWACRCSE